MAQFLNHGASGMHMMGHKKSFATYPASILTAEVRGKPTIS